MMIIQFYRLNQKIVCLSSPVVLRQFLTSIFISVDINVREGELFCDMLCDKGPLYSRQVKEFLNISDNIPPNASCSIGKIAMHIFLTSM